MKRIDLYVTEQQDKWLKEKAEKLEINKSELLRRIIDKERMAK